MKTKLISIFILCIGIFSNAQVIYSNNNQQVPANSIVQENSLQTTFSHLDKSKIPNGLLLDEAIEFIDLKKYNGTMPDSSYTSSKALVDMYNTLLMSRVSSTATFSKTSVDYTNDWKNAQQPDVIPLSVLFYKYSQFSDIVQQNAKNTGDPGKLVINGNYIEDKYVNGIWQNPYEEKYVFAVAPALNSFNKFNFSVALPSNLFLTNNTSTIQKIEYKLADNRAYQILSQNQIIPVSYTATGTYHWTFKLTLTSGEILYSHTQFVVDGNLDKYVDSSYSATTATNSLTTTTSSLSQYSKVEIDSYQIPGPFVWSPHIHKAKATMYIQLAPGHTQITKPLIVAEGFDVGAILSPSKEAGLNNIDDFKSSLIYKNGSNFDYSLYFNVNDNYDIIYVDWGNGTDYIQNNAALLKKAIQYVNANKMGSNKNVVIGQSMGGLIARYALKDMEDLGQIHDTQLFISHDAPHLGANIPIGLQDMLVNVSKTYIKAPLIVGIGEFIVPIFNQGISVNDILTLTDTPAARQMLINYVNKSYQIDNTIHNNWQNELKSKGYPQQLRKVAISNGSECGTDQTLQDLLRIYKET